MCEKEQRKSKRWYKKEKKKFPYRNRVKKAEEVFNSKIKVA